MRSIRRTAVTPARAQLDAAMAKGKANARASKKTPDKRGRMHSSAEEAAWFNGLIDREDRGEISDLTAEPSFELSVVPIHRLCPDCAGHAVSVGVIKPDASYLEGGHRQIDDYKGWKGDTALSRFKVKLAEALHSITVRIVGPTAERKAKKKAKAARDRALLKLSKNRK